MHGQPDVRDRDVYRCRIPFASPGPGPESIAESEYDCEPDERAADAVACTIPVYGVGAKSATERVCESVDEPTELAAAGPASAYDDAAAVDRHRGHGRWFVIELVLIPRPPSTPLLHLSHVLAVECQKKYY